LWTRSAFRKNCCGLWGGVYFQGDFRNLGKGGNDTVRWKGSCRREELLVGEKKKAKQERGGWGERVNNRACSEENPNSRGPLAQNSWTQGG